MLLVAEEASCSHHLLDKEVSEGLLKGFWASGASRAWARLMHHHRYLELPMQRQQQPQQLRQLVFLPALARLHLPCPPTRQLQPTWPHLLPLQKLGCRGSRHPLLVSELLVSEPPVWEPVSVRDWVVSAQRVLAPRSVRRVWVRPVSVPPVWAPLVHWEALTLRKRPRQPLKQPRLRRQQQLRRLSRAHLQLQQRQQLRQPQQQRQQLPEHCHQVCSCHPVSHYQVGFLQDWRLQACLAFLLASFRRACGPSHCLGWRHHRRTAA